MKNNFGYDDFLGFVRVPRETFFLLVEYKNILLKWQQKINLIGKSTLSEIWVRHIIDSAQLKNFITDSESVVDVGSGAGFPGMVLAILGIKNMTLVDSDSKKIEFLKEVSRNLGIRVEIVCKRIEMVDLSPSDVITSRGFASLANTMNILEEKLLPSHKLLLLKGKSLKDELTEARRGWEFECEEHPSVTDGEGRVAIIHDIKKRKGSVV